MIEQEELKRRLSIFFYLTVTYMAGAMRLKRVRGLSSPSTNRACIEAVPCSRSRSPRAPSNTNPALEWKLVAIILICVRLVLLCQDPAPNV